LPPLLASRKLPPTDSGSAFAMTDVKRLLLEAMQLTPR
jgi:hypothetical protein